MHATPSQPTVQRAFARRIALPLWLVAAASLSACATSPSPDSDARFGEALRILQAGQLIAPDAPTRHGQTVPPSDGRSVSEAMYRLNESYRSPPPSSVMQSGAGGASASR
jgi:hypothetical protein